MQWITARQLDAWSDSPDSRTQFPAIVAALIRASASKISTLRIPSGATGDARGWDAHVFSADEAGRVPAGDSFWEFKTGKSGYDEGLQEFERRSNATPEDMRSKATYNFVCSRVWNSDKKRTEDWVAAAEAKGFGWKEIRCLDAIAVEDWLRYSPPVAAKFARFHLKTAPAQGARSTDEYWEEFSGTFAPALAEEVLLAGRTSKATDLLEALHRGPGVTQLIADSPDEVIAFGVAAIRAANADQRDFLEAHTIIVDDMEAGRELLNVGHDLIFFLRGSAAVSAGPFSARGATLVPLGRQQRGNTGTYLERPTSDALAQALQKMAFNPPLELQAARRLARDCGRSVVALQRLNPSGHADPPRWTEAAATLLPAILAGAWDSNNQMDRAILAKLARSPDYYAYESQLRPFAKSDDPPLDLSGMIWAVRAPRDAFLRVGHRMGPEVLALLREVMEQVFGHAPPPHDPKAVFRLGQDDQHDYSDLLRDGLANTLLQIAVWAKTADIPMAKGDGQTFANDVVSAIPGLGKNERVLVALRNQLPYLAEAAPRPLLSALELMLEGDSEVLRGVFAEVEGFISPVSYHTGLLWALETIAWDPGYFERTVLLLARLAAIDPGGQLSNRPINSLSEIYLPWHPSTMAGPELRLAALDQICKERPSVGWNIIASMLPTMHGIAHGTAKPKLREAGSSEIRLTNADVWSMQSEAIRRAASFAGLDPARWRTLVAGMANFAPDDRELALKGLSEVFPQFSEMDRQRVWEDLQKEVERHERFADAKWALPEDQLAPLRALVDKYAPTDQIELARLLFDSWSFDANGDREPASRVRRVRLSQLLKDAGPESVVDLAAKVRSGYEVLDALGHIDIERDVLEAIASGSLSPEPTNFSSGLVAIIANKFGVEVAQDWILKVRAKRSLSDAATALLCLGFANNRKTWAFVKSLGDGVESSYWLTKGPTWLNGDKGELIEAVEAYLRFGRGIAALESSLNRLSDVPTAMLLTILEVIVHEINAGSQRDGTMVSYEVQKAFEELGRRNDASLDDIARHEMAMFPLLEHSEYRVRLFEVLASRPDVYFDVVKEVFRADDEPEADEALSDARRARWRLSYSILSNFHLIPGMGADGIDQPALTSWIDQVRRLAIAGKRLAITDQYIGHVLAHSPLGADGAWPAEAVRDQLERVRSEELERGLMTERFNMRGPHFRDPDAGGAQERDLAAQYRGYAEKAARWPRTQEVLKAIVRGWEDDARREDEWAEQRKMRI